MGELEVQHCWGGSSVLLEDDEVGTDHRTVDTQGYLCRYPIVERPRVAAVTKEGMSKECFCVSKYCSKFVFKNRVERG